MVIRDYWGQTSSSTVCARAYFLHYGLGTPVPPPVSSREQEIAGTTIRNKLSHRYQFTSQSVSSGAI
ncbi:hypothetical protein FRC19_002681 [Serendipita sp. 401]|nr:hypothetical protein FRC19_002681 [Serendipita sp. 401]KAG9039024.1 hypothetical protein FS842_003182 [Serendipita sp. 407]